VRRQITGGSNPGVTYYTYDQQGQLLGEYALVAGQLTALMEYAWLEGVPVAAIRPTAGGAHEVFYIHSDHLGAPRVAVDTQGRVRWRWMAEPFGATAAETNPSGLGELNVTLRLPGQQADGFVGLHYNVFRDYDPTTGRYVQSDPIGLNGGINTYSYVNGNPLRYSDPTGQIAIADDVIIGGTVLIVGCAITPACRQAVSDAVSGLGAILARPFVNDPQAQAEHDEYKRNYNSPPPPFNDPCEELRWRLKREEDLLRARQAWDAKWMPGRHAGMNGEIQSNNAIRKLKDKMKQQGCDCS